MKKRKVRVKGMKMLTGQAPRLRDIQKVLMKIAWAEAEGNK
ncbi:MAG: hypothetical protein P4L51_14495 [Puia sp.]|nr:hypothetical protein [Puia sp.]